MVAPHYRGALALLAAVIATACRGTSDPGGGIDASGVSIVSGNGQVGLAGQALTGPLVVKVLAGDAPARGVTVNFAVASGTATVVPAVTTTDSLGQAKTQVTLGSTLGNVSITATVGGTALVATFTATVGSSTVTLACTSSAPNTPGAGTVLPVSGTGICLGGGTTGAEYALVAFYGNTDSSAIQSLTVTGKGASAVATPNVVPSFSIAAAQRLGAEAPGDLRAAFDATLRDRARRELTHLMPAAQQRMRQRLSASFNMIPPNPTIGSFVTLNAQALQACSGMINRTGRIAAVSTKAIVVADTGNPAGGFTDAEYAGFAAMFDTLISPLDISAFGAPSDIDNNGKVVMFFTKEVNALTKPSDNGVVGGFFFERDLFPLQDDPTQQLQGCAGSNVAEMFYLLVPDPNGTFSKAHTKKDVADLTPGTIVHEFQHLINAGRRLYVNNAFTFEDTWLNEGLSHIAEELLYYRVAGFSPRQNIDSTRAKSTATAFNNYQADNSARYELFLAKPNLTSVYGGGDALETRGATWNMLRYLADHRGSADGDVWSRLVNSRTAGQPNLSAVFGTNYLTQIRDWAISVLADDVPGVTDAHFLEPSWNMRSIFPSLCTNANCTTHLGRYPLAVIPLAEATPASVTVNAGAAAYLRFSVAGGGQASIDWSANGLPVSGLMSFTVVRTK